jgi:hypothetical protein
LSADLGKDATGAKPADGITGRTCDLRPSVSTDASSAAWTGRAVETGDGLLHIEGDEGTTLCGETVEAYPIRWDVRTVVGCGRCLIAAGVPLAKAAASP